MTIAPGGPQDAPQPRDREDTPIHGPSPEQRPGHGHGGRHRLLMLVCCLPMLLIVVVLVATGVAGTGAIVYAVLCTAMMALMMIAMPGHKH